MICLVCQSFKTGKNQKIRKKQFFATFVFPSALAFALGEDGDGGGGGDGDGDGDNVSDQLEPSVPVIETTMLPLVTDKNNAPRQYKAKAWS